MLDNYVGEVESLLGRKRIIRKSDVKVKISVYLPLDLVDEIRKAATAKHRSLETFMTQELYRTLREQGVNFRAPLEDATEDLFKAS